VLSAAVLLAVSVACPEAQDLAGTSAEQRRNAIIRAWRDAKPAPAPVLGAEPAWTVTLPAPPSASGDLDDRHVYVPLRSNQLVALHRETGTVQWSRAVETTTPLLATGGSVFFAQGHRIHALSAGDGIEQWSTTVEGAITAPLASDSGWLFAITELGEALAFRASDGHLVWRRMLGAASSYPAIPGGDAALYFSLADGRLLAASFSTGEPLWEQKLSGTITEPAVARDRVFVGSTDNFFYAFDAATGRLEWKWRNGGDVIGAAADGELVYFASLDNIIRAVNRGNGNQRWKKPTGTRPVAPPRAFGGVVVLAGLMPALTAFVGETGAVMATQGAAGTLIGPPLIDPVLKPFRVSLVSITREGVVEALRPTAMTFRETALIPLASLPGRGVERERLP
jgi:outer membrane protein assembly factor BamB